MQYSYRAIASTTGEVISFAVEKDHRVRLWHVRNVYNGDFRTENKESGIDIELDKLLPSHLPLTVTKKFGVLSIGKTEQTPDINTNRDMAQYFRKLAGLPQIELKVKSHA